ncbi:MAG: hypothetical protein ABSB50_10035, partial [Terracidiphilus sp.]
MFQSIGCALKQRWSDAEPPILDSSKAMLAARIGLLASTQRATGLAAARPARTQRLYIEMLTA